MRKAPAASEEAPLRAASTIIAGSESFPDGVAAVMRSICDRMHWQVAILWLLDPAAGRYRCRDYYDATAASSRLEELSREEALAPGDGLAGRAVLTGAPSTADVANIGGVGRAAAAEELGLRSAFAIPLSSDGRPIGAIEFLSSAGRPQDESTVLSMLQAVACLLETLNARTRHGEALGTIIDQLQVGILVYRLDDPVDDRSWRAVSANPAACSILSTARDDVVGSSIDEHAPELRARGIPPMLLGVLTTQQSIELDTFLLDSERTFWVKIFPMPGNCVGLAFEDVSVRRSSEKLLRAEHQILSALAAGAGADDALQRIATFVEAQSPGVTAAIYRVGADGRLHLEAAPTMPAACAAALDRLAPGPAAEASGTAAWRRELVVVEDVATDRLFDAHRHAVLAAGLKACWAAPIVSAEGLVLGVVAMFFPQPRRPNAHHLRIFEFATGIAAMAIGKFETARALRESEERASALIQYSADALLLVDAHGIIRYDSPTARRLFGLSEDRDLVGHSALSFVHPDQHEWLTSVFRKATKRHEVTTQAFRLVRDDGAVRWLEVTISNQLQHPLLESMILNYHDITDRVEALDRLWEQDEQYRAIVDGVTDAILILDLSGKINTANRAASDLLGYSLEDLIGKAATDLVSPSDRARLEEFPSSAAAGETFYAECIGLRQDGSEVQVIVRGTSFQMGRAPHLLAVISNVSEQKRMQQRLERSDRISSLGRMAATIAHEMNNVMMGIVPFAEIIKRRSEDNPDLLNASMQILKSAERGKGVTQDILRFTRATGEPELRPLDSSGLLADVSDELSQRLPGSVRLDMTCEPGLLLLGDSAQLQQVILNLVMNGGDAMPEGGEVKVRLASCGAEAFDRFGAGGGAARDFAHLSVSDQGHGIAPYLMSHIFEPLFTTKGSGGTGLGLAIVHQIVIAHEGQIHVESAPGRGTTFHLLLRKAKSESIAPSVEQSHDVWKSVRSVVLVEDDPSIGEGLVALLQMEGVACEWIMRGDLAVTRLQSNPPDLLILDVGLPDISGVEVYRRVRQSFPALPTLFSTGHGDHRLLNEFDPSAPISFLSKPYGMDLLTLRVRSLLESRRLSSTG